MASGWRLMRFQWYPLVKRLKNGEEEEDAGHLGVCERSGRVAKVCGTKGTDRLVPLVVVDFYLNEEKQQCEESQRCLDRQCPFNRTTWATLVRGQGIKRVPPEPEWWAQKSPWPVQPGFRA